MSDSLLHYETVIYYQDYETDARWAACRDLMLRSGMDAVTFYSMREHELRHQSLDVIAPRIERMGKLAAELRGHGLETAAALLPTLGWGQVVEEGPFEKIVGMDGTRSGAGSCPFDPNLQAHLLEHARLIGGAGFEMMCIEDDYQTENHRPARDGCLCARHLAAFGEQEGRTWDRQTLAAALADDTDLRARWDHFKVNILADLAARLQEAAGGLPICLLGGMDAARLPELIFDRVKTQYFRPGQGFYQDEMSPYVPWLAAMRGADQHGAHSKPRGIPAAAEITGWPRNAYIKSWSTHMLQSAISAFVGYDLLLFWAGHGPRDAGFERAVTTRRGWRERLRRCSDDFPIVRGLKDSNIRIGPMTRALGAMGLPMSWDADHADAVIGREIVDCAGEADGVTFSETPFYAGETFTDDEINGDYAGWPSTCLTLLRDGDFMSMQVDGDVRVLSQFLDNDSNPIADAVVIDTTRNRLVINHTAAMWSKLISAGKAHQLRHAIEAVTGKPLPAVVTGAPNVFCLVRDAADGDRRVVLVINLALDEAFDYDVELDRAAKRMFVADDDGQWQPADAMPPLPARSAQLLRFDF